MESNQVVLSGRMSEIGLVRYSPAGIPIVEFKLQHESTRAEGGIERKVECEVNCLAVSQTALGISRFEVGNRVKATGFLMRRSRNSTQLQLHIDRIEFIG